ncbi:MAG: hypothetical protein ACRDTA_23920 [Pseudonocardiaceae bacterium]
MSGKKHYHIDMSEWFRQRIRQPLMRVLEPAVLDRLREQTRAEIERDLAAVHARQANVEQLVQGLSEQTRAVEEQTNRRLRDQLSGMERRLREVDAQLRTEVTGLLSEQDQRLRAEIVQERQQRKAEVQSLRAELTADKERAATSARAWLTDARAMRDLIEQTLPHERYAPGRLRQLDTRLGTAAANLDQGMFEAALAGGQDAFHELSELRLDIELRHREWSVLRTAASEALIVLQAMIEQSAHQPVRDEEGRQLPGVNMDVDHWSRGELGQLRAEVGASLSAVLTDAVSMSVDELRAVIETDAPRYQRRLDETVEQAEERLIASQLRVNVADEVVTTLDEVAGYLLDGGQYAGKDQREAFYATMTHPNGNEIVVEVAPEPGGSSGSRLRVLSYDHDVGAEEQRRARATEIARQLRMRGLQVGDPDTEPGEPDPVLIKALRAGELPAARRPATQEPELGTGRAPA